MKYLFILAFALSSYANAGPPGLINVRFSENTKTIQVLGRIIPEIGAFQAEASNAKGPIRIEVPSKYIKFIFVGESVTVRVSPRSDKTFETHVVEILPAIDGAEPTRGVRLAPITLPASAKQDALVNADIAVPLEATGMKVPSKAVAFFGGRHFVIKSTQEAVPIQILSEAAGYLWIRPLPGTNIKSGDKIFAEDVIYFLPRILENKDH